MGHPERQNALIPPIFGGMLRFLAVLVIISLAATLAPMSAWAQTTPNPAAPAPSPQTNSGADGGKTAPVAPASPATTNSLGKGPNPIQQNLPHFDRQRIQPVETIRNRLPVQSRP